MEIDDFGVLTKRLLVADWEQGTSKTQSQVVSGDP